MAAKDTFCKQTLITKTPANGHVSSGGQTGFGARARARHLACLQTSAISFVARATTKQETSARRQRDTRVERKEKTKKNLSVVQAGFKARMAWLGHLFQGFPAITKSRKKGGSIFCSCPQHLATACLFRLLGTNIKFKDGATQVPSRMFLHFSTSRFVAIILHDLRGNNLIQQSLVTLFVSFLTDVLIGSCFLPQQFSAARMNVPARILVTRAVHYSILFNPAVVQRLYLYDIVSPSSIKLF